ncbi:biopolymer transporter ExbD [Bdellovibrionota bacterium FG-2]
MSSNFGQSSHHSQEVELNITSIIDCFTVLITFLLASASFLSIGVFDASSEAPEAAASAQNEAVLPSIEVVIVLENSHSIIVDVSGKLKKKRALKAQGGDYDFGGLTEELRQLKTSFPDVARAVLSAEDEVTYQTLVMSMEQIRKSFPDISFGEI